MSGTLFLSGFISFLLALLLTRGMIHLAPRIGLVDRPGGRKIHDAPKPLGGGVAITLAVVVPLAAVMLGATLFPQQLAQLTAHPDADALVRGIRSQAPLGWGVVIAALLLHVLGLIDDRRALGPGIKLLAQLAVVGSLVHYLELRALTMLDPLVGGPWLSKLLTTLWIVAITNAFNFLDNMDGLSAGVACVCGTALLIASASVGQWFVAGLTAMMLGALLGFLVFNFPPARIFMGDSGSMVVGFLMGVLTIRTTYLPPGSELAHRWYALLSPLLVLALPLYDLVVVSLIRLSKGRSPFVGDTNHFSHRLVRRGMSRRTAVLCLYLVTAATSAAAIVLPHVKSDFGAYSLLAQTGMILGVVALLEQHPLPSTGDAA